MKILQPGRVIIPWVGEWRCQNCKCRWEMEEGDPPPSPDRSGDQRDARYWHMKCPTCGVSVGRQGMGR